MFGWVFSRKKRMEKQLVYVQEEAVHLVIPKSVFSFFSLQEDFLEVENANNPIPAHNLSDGLYQLHYDIHYDYEYDYKSGRYIPDLDITDRYFFKAKKIDWLICFSYIAVSFLFNIFFAIKDFPTSRWDVSEEHPCIGHYLIQNVSFPRALLFFIEVKFLRMHKDLLWFVPGRDIKVNLVRR